MNNENQTDRKLIGVLGQFETPAELLHACDHARQAGITRMDAFSPFPIHGIEKAMGVPRTILPFIVLAVGLSAVAIGIGLQWFTNATEGWGPWSGYQFKISGKPYFSLPANIPVAFEIIVLSSAFAAFFGMLILNKLPRFANPLHRISRFRQVTNDRFFLAIESGEGGLGAEDATARLNDWGASAVEEVWEDQTDQQMPAFVKTAGVLILTLMLLPPVLVYRGQGMTSRQTRLHVNPDMDFQYKYKPQAVGPIAAGDEGGYFFEHVRAAFAKVPGTVARGEMDYGPGYLHGHEDTEESHLTQATVPAIAVSNGTPQEEGAVQEGAVQEEGAAQGSGAAADEVAAEPEWLTEFPAAFEVSRESLERGEQQYNVYCSVCHGYAGDGNGLVNDRALALAVNGYSSWTAAKSLYDPTVTVQPVGRIFDTITNGRGTMGPYGSRISPEDRWAIVLYIKALTATRPEAEAAAGEGDAAAANPE